MEENKEQSQEMDSKWENCTCKEFCTNPASYHNSKRINCIGLALPSQPINEEDVEELALKQYGLTDKETADILSDTYEKLIRGFKDGYKAKAAQQEKMYSLEQMEECWESGKDFGDTWAMFHNTDSVSRSNAEKTQTFKEFIQSLSKTKETKP